MNSEMGSMILFGEGGLWVSEVNNLPSNIFEYQIWNLISVTSDFKVCILSSLFSLTPHGANKLFNQKYDYESNIDLHFMWVFAEYTKAKIGSIPII